jgi:hypothetical protein
MSQRTLLLSILSLFIVHYLEAQERPKDKQLFDLHIGNRHHNDWTLPNKQR